MAESTRDISGVGLEELKALLLQALEDNARLKAENAALREEIARLKGLKGRPKLKPSGMEKAAEAAGAKGGRRKGRRGSKRAALAPDETRILTPDSLPGGAVSRATKTSSSRIWSSWRGRSAIGASAGCFHLAKLWSRRRQRGSAAISGRTSSALS